MLRIIYSGNALPWGQFLVDPNAQFEAGMIGELAAYGNQTVCTVSSGKNPIGLIDDYKTRSFSRAVVDEVIIASVPSPVLNSNNQLVAPLDIIVELANPLILPNSFVSDPVDVSLNPTNGTIRFLAGTPLNADITGTGTYNAIRTVVRYSHQIANVIGEDTTQGSGKVTVWITPGMLFQTDVYDTSQQYPLNALLYCGLDGKLTSSKLSADFPAVAMVTGQPNSIYGALEAKWLL